MSKEYIDIKGITPKEQFPECCRNLCKQIAETDQLEIPCQKPSIECILEIIAHVCIERFKVIHTPLAKKLVILGTKKIKLIYVAENSCQNVHCAHFEIPFCTFIELDHCDSNVIDVCAGIEYIAIQEICSREVTVSLIIFVCPILKEEKYHCNNCDFTVNCKKCNINIGSTKSISCDNYEKHRNHYDDDCQDKHKKKTIIYDSCPDYNKSCCNSSNSYGYNEKNHYNPKNNNAYNKKNDKLYDPYENIPTHGFEI